MEGGRPRPRATPRSPLPSLLPLNPVIAFLLLTAALQAQDQDKDGIEDKSEAHLLQSHLPRFYLSAGECDTAPSAFTSENGTPKPTHRNATIYAQAFPAPHLGPAFLELHYYHLWSKDCGRGGHPLDVEHASILLHNNKPAYHYTAAHEDTVCDVSMARKAPPNTRAEVFISAGKHASFLTQDSCNRNGCGADRCLRPTEMPVAEIINLGEPQAPMPGHEWIQSAAWPLAAKMASDFTPTLLAELDGREGPIRTRTAQRGAQKTLAIGSKPVTAVQTSATGTKGFLRRAAGGVRKALSRN